MKRTLYVLATAAIAVILCMTPSAAQQAEKPAITLNVFSGFSNYTGEQTGWYAKVIKDKFNIKLNLISSGADNAAKLKTLMAAGDLGDIVVMDDDTEDYRDCLAAGLLLDWTKNGLLDKYGKDILARAPKAIEKNKKAYGKGKSVYSIGSEISDMPQGVSSEGRDLTWSPDIRWDLYKKAGMPKIKTMDDWIPVLKKMQELEPKNESGKPVYGFTLFADWDGDKMTCAKQFANMYGYDEFGIVFPHATEDKYEHVLTENGYYYKGLKLYFSANKVGLLDPDSVSQKWGDVWTKFVDGRVLFSWWWWLGQSAYNTPERTAAGKGFQCVPAADQKVLSEGFNPFGKKSSIAIGAKTKYPERVMEFINWLYSTDGLMTRNNGPEKLCWEFKGGKLSMTDFGYKAYENQENTIVPDEWGGGNYGGGVERINFSPIMFTTVDKKYNEPYDHNIWQASLARNPSALVADWRKTMGAMTSKEYLVKNKLTVVKPAVNYTQTPMAMSDDIQQKFNQIQPVLKQYSWKMCFAADDKEFDSLWKEMISKANGLGYKEVLAFWVARMNKEIFEPRKALGK